MLEIFVKCLLKLRRKVQGGNTSNERSLAILHCTKTLRPASTRRLLPRNPRGMTPHAMSRLMMVTLQDFTSDWISFMMGITSSQIGPTFHVKTGKRELGHCVPKEIRRIGFWQVRDCSPDSWRHYVSCRPAKRTFPFKCQTVEVLLKAFLKNTSCVVPRLSAKIRFKTRSRGQNERFRDKRHRGISRYLPSASKTYNPLDSYQYFVDCCWHDWKRSGHWNGLRKRKSSDYFKLLAR